MTDIEINYKNSTIVSINSSGTTILNTAGTYCEDDIEVVYTKPSSSINLQSKTATPGVSAQTIVADTGYDGLSQVDISGDANLLASNIANGVTIFGVTGTLSGGAGWETAPESYVDALINKTITEASGSMVINIRPYAFFNCRSLVTISFPNCQSIGFSAFYNCTKLTEIYFPKCSTISSYAFYGCYDLISASFSNCVSVGYTAFGQCNNLTSISFPNCIFIGPYAFNNCNSLSFASFSKCLTIGGSAFNNCYNLTSVYFPNCTNIGGFCSCIGLTEVIFPKCSQIGNSTFYKCTNLTMVSFPVCRSIGSSVFYNCSKLESVYILARSVPTLGLNTFTNTPITNSTYLGYFGSIYVLSNLLNNYKVATNWSVFADRFVGV